MKETPKTGRRVKENGYSHAKADARKAKRREQAEARQAVYNALTHAEKIALAESRRGNSARELYRLGKPPQ